MDSIILMNEILDGQLFPESRQLSEGAEAGAGSGAAAK